MERAKLSRGKGGSSREPIRGDHDIEVWHINSDRITADGNYWSSNPDGGVVKDSEEWPPLTREGEMAGHLQSAASSSWTEHSASFKVASSSDKGSSISGAASSSRRRGQSSPTSRKGSRSPRNSPRTSPCRGVNSRSPSPHTTSVRAKSPRTSPTPRTSPVPHHSHGYRSGRKSPHRSAGDALGVSRSRHSAFNKPGMSSYLRSSGSSSGAEKDAERGKGKKVFQGASSASPLRSSFDYAKAVKKHNASSQGHPDQQKMNPYFPIPRPARGASTLPAASLLRAATDRAGAATARAPCTRKRTDAPQISARNPRCEI